MGGHVECLRFLVESAEVRAINITDGSLKYDYFR